MTKLHEFVTKLTKGVFRYVGLKIQRYPPGMNPLTPTVGINHLVDSRRLSRSHPTIVFDVGANVGQSVDNYKESMPECQIHSFEPSPSTYNVLVQNVGSYTNLHLNNMAVGSSPGKKMFLENIHSNMSSFLQPGEDCWGEIVKETEVEVTTLDKYCEENNISHISVLKIDTQGYDFEVLRGAEKLMRSNRVELIFMEVIFSNMYKDLPTFDEIYRFLLDRGFRLVSFYQFYYQKEMASWSDALFLNKNFNSKQVSVQTRSEIQ